LAATARSAMSKTAALVPCSLFIIVRQFHCRVLADSQTQDETNQSGVTCREERCGGGPRHERKVAPVRPNAQSATSTVAKDEAGMRHYNG
jgi:hypothetical protein